MSFGSDTQLFDCRTIREANPTAGLGHDTVVTGVEERERRIGVLQASGVNDQIASKAFQCCRRTKVNLDLGVDIACDVPRRIAMSASGKLREMRTLG
jgi:hypothetical protein